MTTKMAAPISKCTGRFTDSVRRFSMSIPVMKIVPSKFKGTHSSRSWIERQLNDPYVRRAKEQNYRCRSAFKLKEIDDSYKILKPGGIVIDCGASPGSWSQVAIEKVRQNPNDCSSDKQGKVIAVDLQDIDSIEGVTIFAKSDFTTPETQSKILQALDNRLANVVISDMAPKASGNRECDHDNISQLCLSVLKFSSQVLDSGGHVVCKIWDGGETKTIKAVMNRMFTNVKIIKPDASRENSSEIFLLGQFYKLRKST